MTQMPSAGQAPDASLVGSLSTFALPHVLTLIAVTRQRGEFQVVAPGGDGRLWIDNGEFTGFEVVNAKTLTQAVFDLALLPDGWFSFTLGREPTDVSDRRVVAEVLDEVRPQVEEWVELLQRVPLNATVRLSATPPGPEVQIRAEQWRVLTTVGTSGRVVRAVLDAFDDDHVVTLRLLRDLVESGLAELVGDDAVAMARPLDAPDASSESWSTAGADSAPGSSSTSWQTVPAAEVEVLPPPISSDPWTAPANGQESVGSGNGWAS
jgi:hypothetical protein